MSVIKDEKKLLSTIKRIDEKIDKNNDQKILAFFESLGLTEREDVPQNFLDWDTILIVVPDRHIRNDLQLRSGCWLFGCCGAPLQNRREAQKPRACAKRRNSAWEAALSSATVAVTQRRPAWAGRACQWRSRRSSCVRASILAWLWRSAVWSRWAWRAWC